LGEIFRLAPYCWTCDEEITFDDEHFSEITGKKIPLDPDTLEPHDCIESAGGPGYRYVQCYNCGEDIYFDNEHVSKRGKKIPLDRLTEEPHRCESLTKEPEGGPKK
jgi:hypothetical protein